MFGNFKIGKWIDFGHKDTIYKLKVGAGQSLENHRRLIKFTKLSQYQTFMLYSSWYLNLPFTIIQALIRFGPAKGTHIYCNIILIII